MKFIIEFDGVLVDVKSGYYSAHRRVVESLGWSALDDATFWRTLRAKGRDGVFLRGARAGLGEKYLPAFAEECERDECVAGFAAWAGIFKCLQRLRQHGAIIAVTLGVNLGIRRGLMEKWRIAEQFEGIEMLHADPRRRAAELIALANGDPRAVAVGSTDSLIRAASQTDLLKIGVSSGACSIRRLHQAGADIVYAELSALADSLETGATDLIEAGLRPSVGRTL